MQVYASTKGNAKIPKMKVETNGKSSKIQRQNTNGQSKLGIRSSANDGSQGSNTTSANTNEIHDLQNNVESDGEPDINPAEPTQFVLEKETGKRGAEPESNKILDTEQTLLGHKKDKCIEVIRQSTEIHELIVS